MAHEEFFNDIGVLGIEGMRDAAKIADRIQQRIAAMSREFGIFETMTTHQEIILRAIAVEFVRQQKEAGTPVPVTDEKPTQSIVEPPKGYVVCTECEATYTEGSDHDCY